MAKGRFSNGRLILGTLCAVMVPPWIGIFGPLALRLPADFSFTADIVSVDNFFDEDRGVYSGGIYSSTDYRYETVYSSGGVSLIKNIFDVKTPDGDPIFAVEREYGIDRDNGAHLRGFGDKNREGFLFGPRNLEEGKEFDYWHINYDGPARMKFVEEEFLYGLKVYHYESFYEGTRIDQTENLTFLPEVGVTRGVELDPHLELWLEPVTGRLVKYRDDTVAYFYDLETGARLSPWNNFSNTFDERSVEANARAAQWAKTKSIAIEFYLPAVFGILALGLFLRRGGEKEKKNEVSLEKFGRYAGILTLVVAGAVLIGWLTNWQFLLRILPNQGGMNPMTALGFVVLGSFLCLGTEARLKWAFVPGLLLLTLSVMQSLSLMGILPFEVDLLLFKNQILSLDFPARMSQYTALSFGLLGIVLLSAKVNLLRRLRVAEVLSSVVMLFSMIALLGFFFEALRLLVLPLFFSAAVHTALLFFLISIACYALFKDRDALRLGGWLTVSGVLFFCVIFTIILTGLVGQNLYNQARTQFELDVARTSKSLEERLAVYVAALQGGKGLFSASKSVEREEWQAYVESLHLQENYPGIQGMGYAVFVEPEDLAAHIASVRAEGFEEYVVKPPVERDLYSAIVYLEPFDERNKQAFGFDMFQEAVRRSAMEQARDTGDPRMSGRITLVQEIDKDDVQAGFLMYVPVYENGSATGTVKERRENILGYVYSPFRARNFVDGVLGSEGLSAIGLEIFNGTEMNETTNLFSDLGEKIEDPEAARFRDTRTVYIAGRPWTLNFVSTESYGQNQFTRFASLLVMILGLSVSVLIAAVFYTLAASRQRAVSYAEVVTRDLRQAKAKDEAMFASIGDGVVATDREGKIILINPAFETILGWKKQDVVGKALAEVVPMFDQNGKKVAKPDRLITKVLEHKHLQTVSGSVEYGLRNGNKVPVSINVSPILFEGKVVGAVEVFRDITHEAEVDKAKTEFVSLASHQLRTPLTSINWYIELLLDGDAGKLSSKQKNYLEEVYKSNKRMVDLVNALLDTSRLDLGTFAIEPEMIDVVALAKDVVKEQMSEVKRKKHKLKESYGKKIPKMNVDPKLMRMVMQNLLSNAVKYTPESGSVLLSLEAKGVKLLFSVKDSGYGIPKAQQKQIFSKLFRADNVREKDAEGNGLGLYIVKNVVENCGGKIWFESKENKGTTFFVEMPLKGMKGKKGGKHLGD